MYQTRHGPHVAAAAEASDCRKGTSMGLRRCLMARSPDRRRANKTCQPHTRFRRAAFESLHGRILLHGGADDGHLEAPEVHYDVFEIDDVLLAGNTANLASDASLAALHPLTSIPTLNSNPGAAVSLYLDFDGHFESVWGSFNNVSTPVFDQDNDASTFSDGELATITETWQRIAEDYAPFNINVTTVEPGSFANGVALRVSIGGDGSWIGPYGGVSYVNSFTNSIANTAYVFSDNLANGFAKYVADASSHEAGHAFGLEHQSKYDADGNLLLEYNSGDGVLAPIMGDSYSTPQSVWYFGTSTSASTFQDDMAVISRPTNGFGYRLDDHGDNVGTSSALTVVNGTLSGSGIIATTSDADYFWFTTGSGAISVTANVAAFGANLDIALELRTSTGALLASANPTPSLSATISTTVSAGTYVAVVRSAGSYGEVGQYTISGSVMAGSFSGGLFRGGMWYLDEDGLGGVAEQSIAFGIPGDTPVVGDWDGDGIDELGIFRNGHWYFDLDGAGGAGESSLHFGIGSDIPVVGDWDGDGVDDIGVFRNGAWYLDSSGNDGIADTTFFFGLGTDVPVVGDWDGDGVDNVGVFRAGRWYFDLDGSGGMAEQFRTFGIGGDVPVVGNWSGQINDDVAVFRNGSWYLDTDGNGGMAEMQVPFGIAGDRPVSGRWVPPASPPIVSAALASLGSVSAGGAGATQFGLVWGTPTSTTGDAAPLPDPSAEASIVDAGPNRVQSDAPDALSPESSQAPSTPLLGPVSASDALADADGADGWSINDQVIRELVDELEDVLAVALLE